MAVGEDPLGYYACLGVQPKAPTSVIKAAYRALAQEWHPDRNTSPEATARFQALQRAYETLADAAKRAAYDSVAASRAGPGREKRQTDAQPRPDGEASAPFRRAEPVRCKRCQAITASPRFRVFLTVAAYVLGATKTPTVGVYCARCEMLVGCRCTGVTLFAGWWSIHGFFWSFEAIYKNLVGANEFAEQTARKLANQVAYFVSTGNKALAYAIAGEAYDVALKTIPKKAEIKRRRKLGYEAEDPLRDLRAHLTNFRTQVQADGEVGLQLKSSQGLNSPAFRAQGALVATLVVTLGLWGWMSHKQEIAAEQARLEAAAIARKQAAAIARAAAEELDAFMERLPPSGPFGPSTNFKHDPPFKVTAPVGANFFVKLADWDTGLPMYTMFVRSGDSTVVHVPRGAYKVKFASGQNWYGEEIRFGPDTAYSIVEDPVTFDVRGDQLPGHEISLQLIRDGNLKRKTISAAQF